MRTNTKVFFIFVALMILQMPGRAGKGQVWRCLQGYGHFEKSPHLFSPPHVSKSFTSIISNLSILSRTVSSLSYLRSLQSFFQSFHPNISHPPNSQISRYFPCFRYKRIFWLTPGLTILKWEDSLISCPLTH